MASIDTKASSAKTTDQKHPCDGCTEWRCYRGWIHGPRRNDYPCSKIAGTGFIPKAINER